MTDVTTGVEDAVRALGALPVSIMETTVEVIVVATMAMVGLGLWLLACHVAAALSGGRGWRR